MERSVAACEATADEAARSRPAAARGGRADSEERASRRMSVVEPAGSGRYSHWNSPPGPRRRSGALRAMVLADQRRGASRLSTGRLRGARRGRAPLRARHAEMTGPPTREGCHAGLPDWPAGLQTGSPNHRPATGPGEKVSRHFFGKKNPKRPPPAKKISQGRGGGGGGVWGGGGGGGAWGSDRAGRRAESARPYDLKVRGAWRGQGRERAADRVRLPTPGIGRVVRG